ncbi:MAG TPA: hypothetical protein VMW36_04325 [Patescibacteria group bacterium]|nr:hypothetical protein [Patescibacteria group bacterium]
MPRYEYQCLECLGEMAINHPVKEDRTTDGCLLCGSDSKLKRIYSLSVAKTQTGKEEAGAIVRAQIEESKRDLKKEKEDLAKKDFQA